MKTYAFLTALIAVSGVTAALADNGSQELSEGKALLASKITIAQAIASAEAQGAGKASSANFMTGHASGEAFYHVEIISADGRQQDLAVNAATGEVAKAISMEEDDHGDNGHDGDQQ